MTPAGTPAVPPDKLRFRRRVSFRLSVRELWTARELMRTLVEREFRVRYKQAYLGIAWALLGPVATLVVFIFLFDNVVEVDTGGAPFALFTYIGLMSWNFASIAISAAVGSLIGNVVLLNKVYCPREVFPISTTLIAAVDTALSGVVLVFLFAVEGFVPRWTTLFVPLVFLVHLAFVVGASLVISALVVYLRDIRHGIGLVLQLGLFATPIGYSLAAVPAEVRHWYSALNPIAPIIDSYRRLVLYGSAPDYSLLGVGAATSLVLLVGGYLLFKRLETGFADVL
jgi:ABC-type polysaccharide/polyol phosphate export permease